MHAVARQLLGEDRLGHGTQVHAALLELQLAVDRARTVQQIVQHGRHVPRLARQHLAHAGNAGRLRRRDGQQVGGGRDRRQRVAQLVRQHGQEVVLLLVAARQLGLDALDVGVGVPDAEGVEAGADRIGEAELEDLPGGMLLDELARVGSVQSLQQHHLGTQEPHAVDIERRRQLPRNVGTEIEGNAFTRDAGAGPLESDLEDPTAAVVIAAVVAGWFYTRRPAPLTDKDTIVLAEFTNTTGDVVFDDTLRQGLAVQLQQSPFLSLISEERIRKTLPLMNLPPDAALTPVSRSQAHCKLTCILLF